jgi:HEAT repeat protein
MAAKALGRLRAQEAAEPLLSMLKDDNINVRRVAVEALGRIASEVSVPALLEALQDDAWWLRWSAAYALGRIGDRQVVPQLLQALRDANGNVRRELRQKHWDNCRLKKPCSH